MLACGGASWARLGSDGAWTAHLGAGALAPFRPANMGFRVDWSAHMAPHFGRPVKGVALRAGALHSRGECVISATGLEGGGIYEISAALRDGAPLEMDLLPDLGTAEIAARLARARPRDSLKNRLRKALRLDAVKSALVMECARGAADLPATLKALPIPLRGPRPMDEAISTAGGLRLEALDAGLMLRDRPGTFAAGEMLDWEAPTGGYLLTACLATGLWAGRHAAAYARRADMSPADRSRAKRDRDRPRPASFASSARRVNPGPGRKPHRRDTDRIPTRYRPGICRDFRALTPIRPGAARAAQKSRLATSSALSWMNSRRGSTTSPISLVKRSSASATSSICTCNSVRASGSSVVSQS